MGRAIDFFVNELCVLDVSMLPYPNMISTLTIFFQRYSRRPNSFQIKEIKKWFFCTGIAQRYSGRGYRKNILNDVAFFNALGLGGSVRFVLDELVDSFDISRSIYSTRSSITIVFYCLLVLQKPIYFENGNPMQMSNIAGEANKRNRHHIFPQKFLQDIGVSRLYVNSILNIGLFPSDENRGFGSRPPVNYLAAFKAKRHFKKALDRHLIPAGVNSAIWSTDERGFLIFINQRRYMVCKAFEDAAGIKIFKNNILFR